MNVTVNASELAKELTFLEKIISKKTTLPVLQNVFLQAHDGWLHLATTDLEIALTTACQATVVEPGAVTLPASKLLELVRSLSSAQITFTLDVKRQVHLTSGIFHSRLQAWPVEDFPTLPAPMDLTLFTPLPRAGLLDLLNKTRFATTDDKRFFMDGALLMLGDGTMQMVALDGKRLALMSASRQGSAVSSTLIPTKAMDLLIALFTENGAADISFMQTDQHLFFEVEGRLLISRRVDGKFPAWERMIPVDYTCKTTVDRAEFLVVVKRAILVAEILTLTVNESAIAVTAASTEVGDADEAVPCGYTGPEITLQLRGEYLVDGLTAASGANVTLAFKSQAPLLLTDGAYQNVIMTMVK